MGLCRSLRYPVHEQTGAELAGIKRLERNVRRSQLLRFQMDLRGNWASVCTELLCNPRRNQVAPGLLLSITTRATSASRALIIT